MGLNYLPSKGQVVVCDYDYGGFRPPEMTKRRLAVVVSPRLHQRDNLCSVVPLSTTPPNSPRPYVVLVSAPVPPGPFHGDERWAKCDMIATVGLRRLDLLRDGRCADTQRRKYLKIMLSEEDLSAVMAGVAAALGATPY